MNDGCCVGRFFQHDPGEEADFNSQDGREEGSHGVLRKWNEEVRFYCIEQKDFPQKEIRPIARPAKDRLAAGPIDSGSADPRALSQRRRDRHMESSE